VQVDDIDDVRNGLLLFMPIKSAFGHLDISFLVDKRDQLVHTQAFQSNDQGEAARGQIDQVDPCQQIGGRARLQAFSKRRSSTCSQRPFRRCLYHQALMARAKAITEKWVSAAYTFDDFSSEEFSLDEKMKLLLSSTRSI